MKWCTPTFLIFVAGCMFAGDRANDAMEAAQKLKAHGDIAGAIRTLQQAIELGSKSAAVEDELGFLLAATNQPDDAIRHFQAAIQFDKNYAPAHYHLGVAYWLANDPERSIPELQAAV